jgi:peptide/nickel transport system ATP-binding protein
MPLLSIRNLAVEYRTSAGRMIAIPDFSLDIEAGESFGLVGESGCGKSTLLMAIMGYLGRNGIIAGGSISFEGHDLTRATEEELRRIRGSRIAIVYQEPASALNPSMTVGRQLMEVPITHAGASIADARHKVLQMLADVHLPDEGSIMRRYPHQLSGGQKQRVVIAMALLASPALLLLDEPTTGLDVTVEATVLDLVNELQRKYKTALLYISHNLGVIARVCRRIGVMYAGELVEDAPAEVLFATPRHPYTRGLLRSIPRMGADKHSAPLVPIPGSVPSPGRRLAGCSYAPRCSDARAGLCTTTPVPMFDAGENQQVRCLRWSELAPVSAHMPAAAGAEEVAEGETVLEVRDLSRVFTLGRGRLVANDRLSFSVKRGKIVAIVGESGSGKSTFARILAGLDKASSGNLKFGNTDLAQKPAHARNPEQIAAIQMVFQNPDGTLNPSHSVGLPIARALRKFGVGRSRRDIDGRLATLLREVRLPASARYKLPRQLSGGQKQRIAIARAFAGNPALLIADEPVSALDVSVQAAVVSLLLQIQAEHHTTMLFISHDLALVRYLADEVVVMYLGAVMEMGPTAALFQPPFHPYTEALLSAVPLPDPSVKQERIRLEGEIPSPINPKPGCRFASRCPRKVGSICEREPPQQQQAGDGHVIFCHIPLAQLRQSAPVLQVAS